MKITLRAAQQFEFYLCLARSFMAPGTSSDFEAMKHYLAEDLEELSDVLGYPLQQDLRDYRQAMAAVCDQPALLAVYSRLFLAPGSRIPVNTGMYFDGALMGGTVAKMEDCYRACGVEKADGFFDLPDHVAVQLEFVSYLYGAEAARADGHAPPLAMQGGHFLNAFVVAWAPRLVAEMEVADRMADPGPNPYLPLARIIEKAAQTDAVAAEGSAFDKGRREIALEKARSKYAMNGISGEDMQFIEKKLQERGLATAHLQIPVEERDAAMGLTRKEPPAPRRKMG